MSLAPAAASTASHNELDPGVGERCQDLGIRVVDSSLGDVERREEVKYFLR